MRIKGVKTGATEDVPLMGVFIAIGHKPNTDIFAGQLEMEGGYIVTQAAATATPPRPASPACSPPATCRTTSIAGRDQRRDRLPGGARRRALPRQPGIIDRG
jgi:hypothetical protein